MRKSGILLSLSSLPSPYGIGSLGKGAYEFVDFLCETKQYYWQILPLNPVSFGNSPYQSFSAFAFNPYYIDPELLIKDNLLTKEELSRFDFGNNPKRIDYTKLYSCRSKMLKIAANRFDENNLKYKAFCEKNKFWLEDYALFMAFKESKNMIPLSKFSENFKLRSKETMERERENLKDKITYHKKIQFLFYSQWTELKTYANKKGVHIIGDIPIYVSSDSCDVWTNPKLFAVDRSLFPLSIAGCPPDEFSPTGQLWGNPIYNWSEHENTEYNWWLLRIKQAYDIFDAVRIDHFRAFYSYYSIDAKNKDAREGKWVYADGEKLMEKIKQAYPKIKIIAEDLGFIDGDIKKRMASSGFPGMKILQFAFDCENSDYLPHNYTRNSVVYTGTHDNPTIKGWIDTAPKEKVKYAMEYFGVKSSSHLSKAFLCHALASVCDTAIIPMQDFLEEGDECRMNTPSTVNDNWIYRIESRQLGDNMKEKIFKLTKLYGR